MNDATTYSQSGMQEVISNLSAAHKELTSLLEDLKAELSSSLGAWEDNARKRRGEGFDAYRLGLQVLANQTVDIWRRGKPLGYTFRDPKLHEILGVEAASAHRARDAVIALYGGVNAGLDVVWTYMKWQEAAGRDYEGLENPT